MSSGFLYLICCMDDYLLFLDFWLAILTMILIRFIFFAVFVDLAVFANFCC